MCQRLTEEGGPPETHFSCCHRQTFLEVGMKSFTTLRSAKMCVPQTVSALGYVPKRWQIRQLESQSPLKNFFSSKFASQAPWDFETLEELTPVRDSWKKTGSQPDARIHAIVLLCSCFFLQWKSKAPRPNPPLRPAFPSPAPWRGRLRNPKVSDGRSHVRQLHTRFRPRLSSSLGQLFRSSFISSSCSRLELRPGSRPAGWERFHLVPPCKLRILEKREPHDNLIDEQDAFCSGFLEGSWQFLAFSSPFLLFSNVQSLGSDSP